MLSPAEIERVEAAAFRSLVAHLRATSDAVSNIDLMGLAGFCRNCLAKWWLRAARSLAAGGERTPTYEDACVAVYGEPYSTWKRSYQTPATPEQLVGAPARSPISVSVSFVPRVSVALARNARRLGTNHRRTCTLSTTRRCPRHALLCRTCAAETPTLCPRLSQRYRVARARWCCASAF